MRRVLGIILALFFLGLQNPVYAHTPNQPPYLKINDQYANLYPVPSTSLTDFLLPQDSAPESYLVNQKINFELDKTRLGVPETIIQKTKFNWEFGDGDKGSGLAVSHSYSKIGSFVLEVFADDGNSPTPQLLDSVYINILPNASYRLPVSKILVNGQGVTNPVYETLYSDFRQPLKINGRKSETLSSQIKSISWDLGDQQTSDKIEFEHLYSLDVPQVAIVLRVKDQNNFFADSYVEVQDKETTKPQPTQKSKPSGSISPIFVVVGMLVGVLSVVGFLKARR